MSGKYLYIDEKIMERNYGKKLRKNYFAMMLSVWKQRGAWCSNLFPVRDQSSFISRIHVCVKEDGLEYTFLKEKRLIFVHIFLTLSWE